MQRCRTTRIRSAVLFGAATTLVLSSCERSTNAPLDNAETPAPVLSQCQDVCSVFDDGRPFHLAHLLRDSSGVLLRLATFVVRGKEGERVLLILDTHGSVLSPAASDVPIIVEADGENRQFTLGELRHSRIAYEFSTDGDVTIAYSIPRALPELRLDSIEISLAQTVHGSTVVSSSGVWGAQKSLIAAAGSPTCTVNTAVFSACGVTGTISPYYANAYAQGVGGIWTSADNTYASLPITVTFSKPVKNVRLTIADPDYSGNNIMGTIPGSGTYVIGFLYDGLPAHPTWDTETLAFSGFTSVQLQAAPRDFVAYRDLTFTLVDTSTVKDSIVITPINGNRKAGQSMTFTAKSAKGGALTIVSWAWKGPLPGITKSPACGTATTCTMSVYESGNITVIGSIANVGNSQASAAVVVAPCAIDGADQDFRIADPLYRANMISIAKKMHGGELGGIPYYDPSTHRDTLIEYRNAQVGKDTCASFVPDFNINPPFVRYGLFRDIADFHTHSASKGDVIPPACAPDLIHTYTALDGPSHTKNDDGSEGGDYQVEKDLGHTGYMVDTKGRIWRWNSPYEVDEKHPSMYQQQSDGNGFSTCVDKKK